jgi:hypothetical protein
LQNRNIILYFRQNENEHVAMACKRIKHMLRTCPSYGVSEWTILLSFYNGVNYMSRNILDSAAGGAFMGKTIVEAKAILESILPNYSQWHTERAPMPSKKVSFFEAHDHRGNPYGRFSIITEGRHRVTTRGTRGTKNKKGKSLGG